jgi:hypothetical protein
MLPKHAKVTKNEKGLKKLLATTLKPLATTMNFFGQNYLLLISL